MTMRLYKLWSGSCSVNPWRRPRKLNLSELGFDSRHHLLELSDEEMVDLEVKVGGRFLREAAAASGWETSEVQAVLLGTTGPVTSDYTEQVAKEAGIPEDAIKVSIHKACDGSVAGLNLALNPDLSVNKCLKQNLAEKLLGKKVLVGGIEGLSRFMRFSHDKNAFQLFGNGAGVIGLIPGQSMKFIVGETFEVFDEEGVLQVRMLYPYSGQKVMDQSLIEVTQSGNNSIRVAGKMHEPESGIRGGDGWPDGYGEALCAQRGEGNPGCISCLSKTRRRTGRAWKSDCGGDRTPCKL